jgi:hypothetical protein
MTSALQSSGLPKRCAVIDTACSRRNGSSSMRPAVVTSGVDGDIDVTVGRTDEGVVDAGDGCRGPDQPHARCVAVFARRLQALDPLLVGLDEHGDVEVAERAAHAAEAPPVH